MGLNISAFGKTIAMVVVIVGLKAFAQIPSFWGQTPPSKAPLFDSYETLNKIQIKGNLTDLLSQDRSPENKPNRFDVPIEITLADGTVLTNVKLSLRGNTSLRIEECPFAKLALKFNERQQSNIFAGLKQIGIGTHCGETKSISKKYGRVQDQVSPIREAQVYKTLDLLGVPTLKARLALIEYIDTSATSNALFFPNGRNLERYAILIERESDTAARYFDGQILQEDGYQFANPLPFPNAQDSVVSPEMIALSVLAESLVENFDWHIRMHSTDDAKYPSTLPLWNISFARSGQFESMLIVFDWDISGWVRAVRFSKKDRFNLVNNRLTEHKSISLQQLGQVKNLFISRKTLIENEVFHKYALEFPKDKKGLKNMRASFEDFYEWLTDFRL